MSYKYLSEWGDPFAQCANQSLAGLVSVPQFQFNRIELVFLETLQFAVAVDERKFEKQVSRVNRKIAKAQSVGKSVPAQTLVPLLATSSA